MSARDGQDEDNQRISIERAKVSRKDILKTSAKVGLGLAAGGAMLTRGGLGASAAVRKADADDIAITSATWAGGVATLNFDQSAGGVAVPVPTVGTIINVAGVTPAGYDGSWTVTAATTSSVSFKLSTSPGGDGTGGAFDASDYLPASTKITNLGLTSSQTKLLTTKAKKLTKGQLMTLATGPAGMTKLKLSTKDVESIATAFALANSQIAGLRPGGCCYLCCCSCCIAIAFPKAAHATARPAIGCCCSCCCCIRINSPGNNSGIAMFGVPAIAGVSATRKRLIP